MALDYYTITSAAGTQPVTLTEQKAWMKITHTNEDTLLTALIVAATQKAELFTNRCFVTRTFTGYFAGLECSVYESGLFFTVRRAPFIAAATVKVMVDDVLVTIPATDYNVKLLNGFSRIIVDTLDDTPDDIPFPYQVSFTAGYGAAAAVPDTIKTAIMETVSYWSQNRGDCGTGEALPGIAKGILSEYRILHTYG